MKVDILRSSLGFARSNVAEAKYSSQRENGRRSGSGAGPRLEDALYLENEGEDLVAWCRDSESPIGKTISRCREREDELPPSVGTVCRERCDDGRSVDSLGSRIKGRGTCVPLVRVTDASPFHDGASTVDKDRDDEDQEEDEDARNSAALPPAEGDPSSRVDEGTFAERWVYFQRKDGDEGRKESADDGRGTFVRVSASAGLAMTEPARS